MRLGHPRAGLSGGVMTLTNAYYNFIRPHTGIKGRTPAEYMGIRIDGTDKWETLLAFASAC
ncbi:MAG: hypothetical protein OXK17_05600, partial [Thaumarchaeota archaeon]|nr:hypothetical protein [Nitrososphaerota archaeon]